MNPRYTSLEDLGGVALSHKSEIDEIKKRFNIEHGYFDAWIYGFLENKKFDIEETVAKLHRRFDMEVNELGSYEVTDEVRKILSLGVIQEIGEDKFGRTVFLVTSKRETNDEKIRELQRQVFDMSIALGTRLRDDNKRCQMVMLINQEGANILKGDLTTLANRVAKYYPGGVDKMFVCKMGRMAAAVAKPVFKRMPAIVSERLVIVDDGDIKKGFLKDIFPDDVLPTHFGGKNDCDNEEHWVAYAERVEKYYNEMKNAIKSGKTVKDWEMEELGLVVRQQTSQQVASPRISAQPTGVFTNHSRQPSMTYSPAKGMLEDAVRKTTVNSTPSEYVPLKTCISEDLSMHTALTPEARVPYGDEEDGSNEGGVSWLQIIEPLPRSLALFFLDELLRWRDSIEEQEDIARYLLLDEYAKSFYSIALKKGVKEFSVTDERWYYGIPYPLRSLQHLILKYITLFNVVYFVSAVVFISCFCACVIVTIFFGFYVDYNYFFPLSAVLMMCMIQAASMCTRAIEMISSIVAGEVIPILRPFGRGGKVVQLILFCVIVCVQFVIFCIYASKNSPLMGLQVSFATGWLSATFIVLVTHLFFFTGYFDSAKGSENRLLSLPLFLIANFKGERTDHKMRSNLLRTSSIIICAIPLTISMLLGISFLISRIVSLFVCTMVAALTAAFTVSYYSKSVGNMVSGTLLRLTLWIMTISWLYATFTFGFTNYSGKWGVIVILSTCISGVLTILSILSIQLSPRSHLLRISFILTLAYIVGCWICCFPIVNFRMGLFCLALMVHNVIGIMFSTKSLTSISGVLFATAAPLLLALACILLGWYGTTVQYVGPQSLPRGDPTLNDLTDLEAYHRYPVCTLTLGDTNSLSIVDVALLTELVKADSTEVFNYDFNNWFSGTGVTYDGYIGSITADIEAWDLYRFTGDGWTFLVINNEHATSSILGTTAWIASIAMSPLSIFLPWQWTRTIVYVMSFAERLVDYKWNTLVDVIVAAVQREAATATGTVVVTGSGFAGGFASMAAAKAKVQGIVFASPGLLHLERELGINHEDYYTSVLQVGSIYGVLDCIGGRDAPTAQKMVCDGDARYCMSHLYMSRELLRACGDPLGRQHK